MNKGKKITELPEVASVATGSHYVVESGDGGGTKSITHENLVKAVGDDLPLGNVGDLQTEEKGTLVGAVNEVLGKTVIPDFEGVTGSQAGKAGLVPAPQVGDEGKVLGASGEWVAGGAGSGGATIHVTTEDESLYGKQVKVSDGADGEMTGTMSFAGVCDITGVLLTGNLTVTCTNDTEQTAEAVVNVTYYGTYNVDLDTRETVSYINVTTTETSLYGKTVTASGGESQQRTAQIGNDGKARIKVDFTGDVAVTAFDGVNTASGTLNIAEPGEQSLTLQLYHMTVTTDDERLNGHFATLQKGGQVRTGTFVGKAAAITFDENFVGACKVSATDGERSAEKAVTIVKDSYSYSEEVTLSVTYTLIMDFSKSAPDGIITHYEDDAAGMERDFTAWRRRDIFKDLRNCVVQNGSVLYYLDPDDLTKQEGGEAADITTLGNDVMLEIPERLGYMIEWQNTGKTILKVSVTNRANAEGYEYDAFSLDAYNDCDKIYIGTFKGYRDDTGLYSSSGRAVTVSQTIDTFRASARLRGAGYQQRTYGSVKLMQVLYLISHGTTDSQTAVGQGYVKSGHTAGVKTGGTNAYGFDCEVIRATNPTYMTDQEHQVKCLGIEDFWGNYWEFVEGLCSDASRNILTCRCAKDFATDGTGYENNGNGGVIVDLNNYMNLPQGGSKAGFTPRQVSGSQTTYFCDYANLRASSLALFGGCWNYAALAGAFQLSVWEAFSFSNASVGARLMYMHKDPTASPAA